MRLFRPAALALLLLTAALIAAGCGDDSDDDSTSNANSKTPAPLKADGDFRVCTDVPYPPAEYMEGNKFVGYEIDIMTEVADRLGTKAVYQKTLFDAIIPALQQKRCDAIISSMNVTPEREKEVEFVEYMEIGQSLMIDADNGDTIATLDDLAGKTVAVQVGTTLKDALDAKSKELTGAGKDKITVQTFPDGGSAAAALKAGRVDVFFADSPVVAEYVNKDDSFKFAGEPIDPLPVGIALRKDDEELEGAVEDAIEAMYDDGKMNELLSKWKVEDFGLTDE